MGLILRDSWKRIKVLRTERIATSEGEYLNE